MSGFVLEQSCKDIQEENSLCVFANLKKKKK